MSGSELMCNAIGVGVKENRKVDARNNYCEQNKREFKQQTCVSDEFVAKSRVTILWRKQLSYITTMIIRSHYNHCHFYHPSRPREYLK